jgi:gluconate 2-dehydrogenase alpha chain
MAKTMKAVDAVLVGVGWSGSIMARELTKAGLTVVALERGGHRTPGDDFTIPSVRDDLKYRVRLELMLDTATETVTMRHEPSETALPMRRWGAFPPGDGLGGAGTLGTASPGASRRASSCCAAISPTAMAATPFPTT